MSVAVGTKKQFWPRLVGAMLAPLILVERARGRRRLGLIALYSLALLVAGAFLWRATCLIGLPDIGEPFDLEQYGRVVVPPERNAYVLYAEAASELHEEGQQKALRVSKEFNITDWPATSQGMRAWTEDNGAAIGLYLQGADRPDALVVQPGKAASGAYLQSLDSLEKLTRLALLEGSRLEHEGDLEGAWRHYRAVLRTSRHVLLHMEHYQGWFSQNLLQLARPHIASWSAQPGLSAKLLHRAMEDVAACAAMTPPPSAFVRSSYFALGKELESTARLLQLTVKGPANPDTWWRDAPVLTLAKFFLNRDPERNRRVLKMIVAGQLAQCDRPAEQRARLVSPQYMIYAVDSATPAPLRSIAPEKIARWAATCEILKEPWFSAQWSELDSQRSAVERIGVEMAVRAYILEQGSPPKQYGDLVGRYVPRLPDGYAADDVPILPEGDTEARGER